jgi:hypothetical protein
MTALDTTPVADDATGERRAAARDAYRTSLAEGVPLTGAELGRRFGLSPRWGRLRVAEVHAEAAAAGNGLHRGRHVAGQGREHDPTGLQAEHDRGEAGIGRRAEPASDRTDGSRRHPDRRSASEWRPREDAPTPVTPLVHGITTLAVLAVALVAAIASYDHQRALAELAGEGWRAWLLPVSVDGLVVAASMSMLVRRVSACPLGRSPGRRCSPVSVRDWLPMLLPPIPRWSAGSWRPGRRSLSCSPGSCSCGSEHLQRRAASHDALPFPLHYRLMPLENGAILAT